MRRNYKGSEPVPFTCPQIDRVISFLENIGNSYADEKRDCNFYILLLDHDIRNANEVLRDWGNEMHDEKEYLSIQLRNAESEISDLKDQIGRFKEALLS